MESHRGRLLMPTSGAHSAHSDTCTHTLELQVKGDSKLFFFFHEENRELSAFFLYLAIRDLLCSMFPSSVTDTQSQK